MPRAILALTLLTLVLGCGREPTLQGEWRRSEGGTEADTLIFHRDGTVIWRFPQEVGAKTYALRYHVDRKVHPHLVELSGFESGPLAGKTLYGILEFEGRYAFRFEAEPGESRPGGDAVRPGTFTDDANHYERVR